MRDKIAAVETSFVFLSATSAHFFLCALCGFLFFTSEHTYSTHSAVPFLPTHSSQYSLNTKRSHKVPLDTLRDLHISQRNSDYLINTRSVISRPSPVKRIRYVPLGKLLKFNFQLGSALKSSLPGTNTV